MKRLFDFLFALIAIIFFSIPMLVLYLWIRLKLGTPVIFRQNRLGKNEKLFSIYKFRTMSDLKDENGNLLPDGKRLTPLGNLLRTLSLDELPQLINILKGEMSFIGPRALFAEYKTLYSEKERLRHTVRPGITGWAQVNGRNSMSWKDRFLYDIYYVENQSWIFDLKIACLTIGAIIRREGINQSEGVTKEKYNGSN
jgi:undecaprenyl phosphate N,N'-diacetylbacillosamine 1-phosphate transferase